MKDFKTTFNELLTSDRQLSPAIPAPIVACLRLGSIPRSMVAIVTAAKRAKLSLNDIASPGFLSQLSQLSSCQGGVREAGGGSSGGSDDVAAIAAGYHSISVKQLIALRAAGIDLDVLFESITTTTEAA